MDYTASTSGENAKKVIEGNIGKDAWTKKLRQELIVSGYSPRTVKMYLCYFNEFVRFSTKPIEQTERDDLVEFLAEKKGLKVSDTHFQNKDIIYDRLADLIEKHVDFSKML